MAHPQNTPILQLQSADYGKVAPPALAATPAPSSRTPEKPEVDPLDPPPFFD